MPYLEMQAVLPDDIRVSFEFDQSPTVTNAVRSLATEGLLGAVLTGLMVLVCSSAIGGASSSSCSTSRSRSAGHSWPSGSQARRST